MLTPAPSDLMYRLLGNVAGMVVYGTPGLVVGKFDDASHLK